MASGVMAPLKWHGGKGYLAGKLWEIARRIPHLHRVEVYGGGLSFTLASDPDGYSEVVNDLNGELTTFWSVMQSPTEFAELRRMLEATPFSEIEWNACRKADLRSRLLRAYRFFVLCRQSLAGRMDSFAPLS